MTFITGLFLIDAPASALNNLGNLPGSRTDNIVGVKAIRTREGYYPYVSAQAFRYWLRNTLELNPHWKAAPIYREEKIAYTDANPIEWWDDDLFGYMRAPSKKTSAVEKRSADESRAGETPTADTITRVSPFRVSTLVSVSPLPNIPEDFGVMSRHEGHPVPHEHQFYRTTLKGLFSLNLKAVGTFSYRQRTGYRNLDDVRQKIAEERGLTHSEEEKTYRLNSTDRLERISALLKGLACLEGGAKQTIHYTDVTPAFVILALTRGGNNIFGHIVGHDTKGLPVINTDALDQVEQIFAEELITDTYVGWVKGYLDDERTKFEGWANGKTNILLGHPKEVYDNIIRDLHENVDLLD